LFGWVETDVLMIRLWVLYRLITNIYLLNGLQQINIDGSFVLQGKELENITLVVANTSKCDPPTAIDCITVAINVKAELEFVTKPVYLLSLEVEVRNIYLSYTRKVTNSYYF